MVIEQYVIFVTDDRVIRKRIDLSFLKFTLKGQPAKIYLSRNWNTRKNAKKKEKKSQERIINPIEKSDVSSNYCLFSSHCCCFIHCGPIKYCLLIFCKIVLSIILLFPLYFYNF